MRQRLEAAAFSHCVGKRGHRSGIGHIAPDRNRVTALVTQALGGGGRAFPIDIGDKNAIALAEPASDRHPHPAGANDDGKPPLRPTTGANFMHDGVHGCGAIRLARTEGVANRDAELACRRNAEYTSVFGDDRRRPDNSELRREPSPFTVEHPESVGDVLAI